jgi:hypothetical protein
MAVIETLKEKVQKATEKVDKCKGTIERHKKQLDKKIQKVIKELNIDLTGKSKEEIDEIREPFRGTDNSWIIYEVIGKLDDIKGANKKLREAEIVLENWQTKLAVEVEKERFLEGNAPQVIKDFLEEWKVKAYEWHIKKYDAFLVFKKDLYAKESQAREECSRLSYKERRAYMEEKGLDNIQKRLASFAGAIVMQMSTYRNEPERLAWLEKTLEQDKKAKMLDLIVRINNVVGTIVDATNLRISNAGNLNGFIIGENGRAKVETIGAGGYAVQCFHYRTLVHKI